MESLNILNTFRINTLGLIKTLVLNTYNDIKRRNIIEERDRIKVTRLNYYYKEREKFND